MKKFCKNTGVHFMSNKPKYKYLIYTLLKHFRHPYYNYVRVGYDDTEKYVFLTLRKTVFIDEHLSTEYKNGMKIEVFKPCWYKLITKKFVINKDIYEHFSFKYIIENIEKQFKECCKNGE